VSRRVGHARGLAAIPAVMLAASCASGVKKPGASGPEPSPTSSRPATIVVEGKTLYLQLRQDPIETVFVDSTEPRLLYVRYELQRRQAGRFRDVCAPPVRPFAYVAGQTQSSVTVGIGGYRPRVHREGGGSLAVACGAEIVGYARLPVRLDAPLGNRSVRDDLDLAGAQPVHVITEHSVPTPGWIPDGYVYERLDVGGVNDDVPERVYRHNRWELDILAGKPEDFPGTGGANTVVNDHPATMSSEGDYRSITWTVSPERAYEVIDFMANQRVDGGYIVGVPDDLTVAQLLEIASSLP
jgi:hypothetical protein